MSKFAGIFCFSLFMGTLVGLSSTPIVSGVVATLTGLLGLILGLTNKDKSTSDVAVEKQETESRANQLAQKLKNKQIDYSAIGVFGLAALAGVFLGLYVRTVQPWHPTPAERFAQWKDIGIEDQRIGELIVFEQLGLLPEGLKRSDDAVDRTIRSPVLFSADASIIAKMEPDNFPSLDALRSAWIDQGGSWAESAKRVQEKNLPDSEERKAFELIWSLASE